MPNNFSNFNRFLKPDYRPSYNGFGLDRRDVFSLKAGQLNLAYVLHCIQGDHHEIEPVSLIQTDGFNQANFTRMSQHIDYYFVPYTCIVSRFNEWFQQTSDPANSIFMLSNLQSDDYLPYFHLGSLIWALCFASSVDHAEEIATLSDYASTSSTASYVGVEFLNSVLTNGHHHITNDYLKFFVSSVSGGYTLVKDKFGYPVYLNTIRLLDQGRYGNYLPVVKLPLFTGNWNIVDVPSSSSFDSRIRDIAQDYEVLFLPSIDVHLNLLTLAAYQAVCHNYYVNTYYERPDTFAYNFDDLYNESGDISFRNSEAQIKGNQDLFTINYRPWKKDIFLSALPNSQFGDVSVVNILSDVIQRKDGSHSLNYQLTGNSDNNHISLYTTGRPQVNFVGELSTLDLVKANALQAWKQQVGRAGYRTADRFRATFGREPGFDPMVQPVPIGSVYKEIMKDTVVGTSGDDFGDKRATGSSYLNNEKIVFDCPCFGVIVGIMSILPEADYDSFGIDKHHTYFDPFDFPTPQLQDLGFVPVNVRQLSVYSDAFYSGNGQNLGFVPEYSEDKQAYDLVHGEFSSMPVAFMKSLRVSPIGAFSSWVSSRVDMESFVGTIRQFYVDPAVLDPLFLVSADAEQSSDPFKVVFYSKVRSYRPLHVLGLPQF